MKMRKFGTRNVLFGYFHDRILKKLLSNLKSDSRICQIAKFREKMKMLKFGTKNALLGIIGLEF